ncbi:MAG: ribonuclease PH [Rhodospirillaceae bacterium]|jgi:ribonuclease PH|nr:ribonuclease PH [Rhodospirillaceae bacterium]
MRPSGRAPNQLRSVTLEPTFNKYAEGSCFVKFGNTHVLCTASVDKKIPAFLRKTGKGWITAEFGMLPRSTHIRNDREAVNGKQRGRTQEIQRLIGRSLRAVTKLTDMSEIQIKIDCDVIQADGGTRAAAITGSYVALYLAFKNLISSNVLSVMPLTGQVAAVSCGIYNKIPVLDLDYNEDIACQVDSNFVLNGIGEIIEIQGTAEGAVFTKDEFLDLLDLAQQGISNLIELQRNVLNL